MVSLISLISTHAFGELNLFLRCISENTQGMDKACVTVNGLQVVDFHSRICAISKIFFLLFFFFLAKLNF